MFNSLGLDLVQVTENAAIAGYRWLGAGDKEKADAAAVEAMRKQLNKTPIQATIVIGEGEIDEAPMLYIGEKLGLGGIEIDIAVDPIDGTRMTAMGQANALTVLAAAEKGSLLKAPDMYMEKLVVGAKAKEAINLDLPLEDNIKNIAHALNKKPEELTFATLDKPRHLLAINKMRELGVKVYEFPDGDVAASLLTCLEEYGIDAMYCIGGAPEGVISSALVKALGGNMHARLLLRENVKGRSIENQKISEIEFNRCIEMKVMPNKLLKLDDLVKTSNVIFSATAITKGDLLQGIKKEPHFLTTETLLIQGESKTVRRIQSTHYSTQVE